MNKKSITLLIIYRLTTPHVCRPRLVYVVCRKPIRYRTALTAQAYSCCDVYSHEIALVLGAGWGLGEVEGDMQGHTMARVQEGTDLIGQGSVVVAMQADSSSW